jgi:hypothetical protein
VLLVFYSVLLFSTLWYCFSTLSYCFSTLFILFFCSVVLFVFCVLYCSLFLYCTVSACDVRAATLIEVFPCFFSVVRQIPGYNSQRRGTARTSKIRQFFIVMYVPFSVFCVLFVCKCVLYYCHRVSTQFQLNIYYTGCLQKNGAVSKINKKFICYLTRAKRTPSAAASILCIECVHPGSHDAHPHDNRIRPRLGVACPL